MREVLIAIVWFKLSLAPSSSLVEGQSLDLFTTRLLDLHRHGTVAVLMIQHMIRWSALIAVAIFPLMCLAAIGMTIRSGGATYDGPSGSDARVLVYVTTPFEISCMCPHQSIGSWSSYGLRSC